MRNLKRLTALALVIVMFAGLMITGTAAKTDFSDENSINQLEAVEVLSNSKIGIINGYEDGTFKPAGLVTREEASKMICAALLGGDYGSALSDSSQIFSDVLASRWSSGYIGYLNRNKIIDGYGDGKFGPADNVTYAQLSKLLLTSLGYGKNNEYTGTGWLLSAVGDANRLGFFRGLSITDYSAAATRENAAQMIFNALDADMVKYSKDTESYIVTVTGGETLGKYSFSLEKGKAASDKYGRPGYKWEVKGKEITGIYTENAFLTYTAASDAMNADLRGYDFTSATELIINGEYADLSNTTGLRIAAKGDLVTYLQAIDGRGIGIEFYANGDDEITAVVVVMTYFGQVTRVTAANSSTGADRFVTAKAFHTVSGAMTERTGVTFDTTSFAVDDYVLIVPSVNIVYNATAPASGITPASGNAVSVTAAESVRGSATSVRPASISVSGTAYNVAAKTALIEFDSDNSTERFSGYYDFDGVYNFYLDTFGNIISAVTYSAGDTNKTERYLYVNDSEWKYGTLSSSKSLKMEVFFTDGTSSVVDYNVKSGDKIDVGGVDVTLPSKDVTGVIPEGWYYFTVNSSGKYVLKPVSAISANGIKEATHIAIAALADAGELTSGSIDVDTSASVSGISGRYTNTKTVLRVVAEKVTTYTGRANFPEKTYYIEGTGPASADHALGILYLYSGSTLNDIVVLYDKAVSTITTYGYFDRAGNATAGSYYYFFYVGGDYDVEYRADSRYSLAETIYEIDVASDGYASFTRATSQLTTDITAASDSFFRDNGKDYFFDKDVAAYDVSEDAEGEVATIKKGDTVRFVVDTDGETVLAAFITERAD